MTSSTPNQVPDDKDLLLAIMLKDENREEAEAAFNEFHHRHAEFLWRAINKYFSIVSEHEKREIINETFIVIWNLAEKYDDSRAKPSTWLFAIAKNKARDMLRRKSRIVEDSVDSLDFHDPQRDDFWREQGMEPQEDIDPDEGSLRNPLINVASQVLEKLPDREREIVLAYLQFWPDDSPETTKALAERFNTTAGNIRQIRHRTLKKIEEALKSSG